MDQIAEERAITAAPPVVRGGLVVVPQGLLDAKTITPADNASGHFAASAANRREVELAAMEAVMEAERNLAMCRRMCLQKRKALTSSLLTQMPKNSGLLR